MRRVFSRQMALAHRRGLVALFVAIGVIALLEVVQVYHDQRSGETCPPGPLQLSVQYGKQEAKIEEPGQGIGLQKVCEAPALFTKAFDFRRARGGVVCACKRARGK